MAIESPVRNVYGTGADLQNAKNILGASGGKFNFIDTGKAGFQGPASFSASDVVLGGTGAVGGIAGDAGSAVRLWGQDAEGTRQSIERWARPLSYVDQVNNAINQVQTDRAPIPTYNGAEDINTINTMYQQQQEAIQTRLRGQTETGVANLNRQAELARPQYQQARNQVDVIHAQEQRKLNENLASQGLAKAGRSLTSNAILGASRVNQIGALTGQEQRMVDEANFQIQQLRNQGATEENAQILELNAKKNEAILNAKQRDFDRQLQTFQASEARSQQDLQNMMQGIQFAYGVSKDQAQELFQREQFDYTKAQDLADKLFKEAQFNWQKDVTKIDQAFREKQYTAEQAQIAKDNAFREKQFAEQKAARVSSLAKSSGSSSSSSGAKATSADVANRMWSQFYQAQEKGVGATWLAQNRANILNSGVSNANTLYQQMNDMAEDKAPTKTTPPPPTTTPKTTVNPTTGQTVEKKFIGGWLGQLLGFGK